MSGGDVSCNSTSVQNHRWRSRTINHSSGFHLSNDKKNNPVCHISGTVIQVLLFYFKTKKNLYDVYSVIFLLNVFDGL